MHSTLLSRFRVVRFFWLGILAMLPVAGTMSQAAALGEGGNITNDWLDHRTHVFTGVGDHTFEVSSAGDIQVLVVAGGGGGGSTIGGGGGAGGLIYSSVYAVVEGPVTLKVGAGGAGAPTANPGQGGLNGSNSVFGALIAIGGGAGGGYGTPIVPGNNGGSGGGHPGNSTAVAATGEPGQGSAGGTGSASNYGGGGGGATSVGTNGSATSTMGGSGRYLGDVFGTDVGADGWFAGGGGGGIRSTVSSDTRGGAGGGGVGGVTNVGGNSTANTGGGGGGGGYSASTYWGGGTGGTGVVIVRYEYPLLAVVAQPATGIGGTNATLHGQIGGLGAIGPDVYFCWEKTDVDKGTDSTGDWANVVFISDALVAGESFSQVLNGLDLESTYFYRVYATNSAQEDAWSEARSFTTIGLPEVSASAAVTIGRTRATLQGVVTDIKGDTPLTGFIWWKDGDSVTNWSTWGVTDGAFSYTATGLEGATAYRFQAWASNLAGVAWSSTLDFNTLPLALVNYNWTGNTSTDWYIDTNWDPVGIPDVGDGVRIVGPGKTVVLDDTTPVLGAFGMTNATLVLTNAATRVNADSISMALGTVVLNKTFTDQDALLDRVDFVADPITMSLTEYRAVLGSHTLDLANMSGNTMTSVSFKVFGAGMAYTARVSVVNSGVGDATLVATTLLELAGQGNNDLPHGPVNRIDGHLVIEPNVTLIIGSETTRATELRIAESTGGQWNSPDRNGSLVVQGGIQAWIQTLRMSVQGQSFSPTYNSLLDLTEATGFLDIAGGNLFFQSNGSSDTRLGDGVDLRVGRSNARANVSLSTPGVTLGAGQMHMYVTNFVVPAGVRNFNAGNVSAGVLDVSGNMTLCGGGLTFDLPYYSIVLGDGIAVKIGDPALPVNMDAGFGTYVHANVFRVGTNRFEAYLNRLSVGKNTRSSDANRANLSHLDLSQVTGGILVVTNELSIASTNGYNPSAATITRLVRAEVILSDSFTSTIGTPSAPAVMAIGYGEEWRTNIFRVGGTFNANLSSLVVGWRTTASAEAGAMARLDLATVTNGTLNVAGAMIVGRGRSSIAEVKLGDLAAAVTDLYVGSTNIGAKGTLTLNGTAFSVNGNVALDGSTANNAGTIQVELEGVPAGLILANTATVTAGDYGKINIVFEMPTSDPPPPHYWGLRWEGNKVAELEALETAGKLTWDDSDLTDLVIHPVQIYQSGGYTYLGARMGRRGTVLTIR